MNALPEVTLAELIRYNNWANQQIFDACQNLDESQLEVAMPGVYGSIRDTLAHIIEGEAFYVGLLTGNRPRPPFQWEAKPGLAEMSDFANQVGNALVDAINRVHPNDMITEQDQGNQFHYQAIVVLIQIINHGIEHRTNITTILSAGQLTSPVVDGWGYLNTHQARFGYFVS